MLFCTYLEDTCILRLALLASSDSEDEDCSPEYKVWRFLRHPSLLMLSLVLTGLATLSQRSEVARKMQVFLPDMMKILQKGDAHIKTKALAVIQNIMRRLKKTEASPIAVQLAEKLLPLFDEELSQLREISICLFRDLMKTVLGNNKRRMKTNARMGLLPLFFRMSDQTQSVAKASREALLAEAELLSWNQLKHLVRTQQTWRIGKCLLVQDRSRAEEYLDQSLPYLRDAQASVQEAAVRLIGLAARPSSPDGAASPPGTRARRCSVRSAAPCRPWRKTVNPPSVPWQTRPSTSCSLPGCSRGRDGPCERCAADAAEPGRGAAPLWITTLSQ
ncbi:maestro heat-like repeat-containing protein family member 7 [Opisthocomus hoazin]|uniref:maestro heat-like repeat-containing protein family member 7 n=1 Tax=Opisthocomus hoazin TaxID=30419 RepID=UPI003F5326FA